MLWKGGRKEGRKEGIIGRSITAQVGRGRCDQRSWLCIAIFSRCLSVTTRATSVVEGRKEGRNNRKEYHSTSRARKVRSEIVASYCNILKVSQVLAFCQICHVGQGSEYHVTEHVTEHV